MRVQQPDGGKMPRRRRRGARDVARLAVGAAIDVVFDFAPDSGIDKIKRLFSRADEEEEILDRTAVLQIQRWFAETGRSFECNAVFRRERGKRRRVNRRTAFQLQVIIVPRRADRAAAEKQPAEECRRAFRATDQNPRIFRAVPHQRCCRSGRKGQQKAALADRLRLAFSAELLAYQARAQLCRRGIVRLQSDLVVTAHCAAEQCAGNQCTAAAGLFHRQRRRLAFDIG